ncbi:hypothetical protein O181_053709 [Austropuccinia psidii MF-1]|uniref:Uncharacterized protein n=1 Tax=Austropuccinia psidii MF-1 TaxID=1389203 RepID=A0A9Q3E367_9BASI|nr:hypothetical protein [Austropuccinia psidii MF-1]
MEHGQKEVEPSIPLEQPWSKFPGDISQRDRHQRHYDNHQNMEAPRKSVILEERATRIRENQATIQAIEGQLSQTGPTIIPSGSQGEDQPNSQVASQHSGTSRLNTGLKGHASIWYTERNKSIAEETVHGGRVKLSISTAMGKKIIGKYSQYRSSSFKDKQPLNVNFKDKPKEGVAEVTKKKNSCHNCGSTDDYSNNCPKAKKKVYDIEKVLEEESPTEDSESDPMSDAIREQSDGEKYPRGEFIVEYQEETQV